ncbi:hypothetical protein ACN28I_05655 [Archangium gephyra]|uniref:hypothetical protein n=1 Tax=Archangium gephyra TaxID=48 RepID=UPI003B805902
MASLGLYAAGCASQLQEPEGPPENAVLEESPGNGPPGDDPVTEAPPELPPESPPEDGPESPPEDSPGQGPGKPVTGVHRVADINTVPRELGSHPSQFVRLGDGLFFTAHTPNEGQELWRWDARQGARRVLDLVPGPESPGIRSLTRVGEFLYFVTQTDPGSRVPRLWRSDGTAVGTRPVTGLVPPFGDLSYAHLADVPGRLLLVRDVSSNVDLWSSDGTPHGTDRLWNTLHGPRDLPERMVESRGTLYFVAVPPCPEPDRPELCRSRPELWRADSTGPRMLWRGAEGSTIKHLTPWKDSVFFFADGGATERPALWKTDGTGQGTVRVTDLEPKAGPQRLIPSEGRLFFLARRGSRFGVWATDGTAGGTAVWLHDVLVESEGRTWIELAETASVGSTLYFVSPGPSPRVVDELWRTDGTPEGTRRVLPRVSNPRHFLAYRERLYFVTDSADFSSVSWMRTDGTPEGTELVKAFRPVLRELYTAANAFTVVDGEIYFQGDDGQGVELWTSRGTASDTRLVQDIVPATGSSEPRQTTVVDGTLYFTADDGLRGQELWRTDGSAAGTRLVREFTPGPNPTWFQRLIPFGSRLALTHADPDMSFTRGSLWVSDGTAGGTHLLRGDIKGRGGCLDTSDSGGCTGDVSVSGDTLYVSDSEMDPLSSRVSYRLWAMRDGEPLRPLQTWNRWNPSRFKVLGSSLLFIAASTPDSLTWDEGIWHSDGTAGGTRLLTNLARQADGFVRLGTGLYFTGREPGAPPSVGAVLWRADEATGEAHVVSTGEGSLDIHQGLRVAGQKLFFLSRPRYASLSTWELWVSDGTSAGTHRVKQLRTNGLGWPGPLTALGDSVLFWFDDPVRGWGLWRSDGTEEGTVLVKALYPALSQFPLRAPLFALPDGKSVVFAASDGVSGMELWWSDGTAEGTFLFADVAAGPGSSNPDSFAVVGNTLYFSADDQVSGRELWAAPLPRRAAESSTPRAPRAGAHPAGPERALRGTRR